MFATKNLCLFNCEEMALQPANPTGIFDLTTFIDDANKKTLITSSSYDLIIIFIYNVAKTIITLDAKYGMMTFLLCTLLLYLVVDKWLWRSAKGTVSQRAPNSVITSLPITNNINISHASLRNKNNAKKTNAVIAEPQRYDGNTNLRIWLNSFDRYAVDLPDTRRFDALHNLLTEELQAVVARYQYSDDDIEAFGQLRGVLNNLYGKDVTPIDPIIELSTRAQRPNESLQQFAGALEALARSSFPVEQTEFADKLVASQFKNGINNAWVRKEIMLAKITNLKDLLEEAVRVEDVYKQIFKQQNISKTINMIQQEIPDFDYAYQTPTQQNQDPQQYNQNNNPYNSYSFDSSRFGGRNRNGQRPRNKFFNQNQFQQPQNQQNQQQQDLNQAQQNQNLQQNHLNQNQQNQNPNQQTQTQQNSQQISQSSQPNQNSFSFNAQSGNKSNPNGLWFNQQPKINLIHSLNNRIVHEKLNINGTCLINSKMIDFQADSDADVTVISQEVYQKIKRTDTTLEPIDYKVTNASKENINILGSTVMNFDLGGYKCRSSVLIADQLSRPCLLGKDLMSKCPSLKKPIDQLEKAVDKITDYSLQSRTPSLAPKLERTKKNKKVRFSNKIIIREYVEETSESEDYDDQEKKKLEIQAIEHPQKSELKQENLLSKSSCHGFTEQESKLSQESAAKLLENKSQPAKAPFESLSITHPFELITLDFVKMQYKSNLYILVRSNNFNKFVHFHAVKDTSEIETGMLRAFANSKRNNWEEYLECLSYAYNTAVHATTNQTPQFLMFGRKPKIPMDLVFFEKQDSITEEDLIDYDMTKAEFDQMPNERSTLTKIDDDVDVSVKISSEYARELVEKLKFVYAMVNKNKELTLTKHQSYYDRKFKPFKYEIGDLGLKDKLAQTGERKFRTLGIIFDSPYQTIKIVSHLNYLIKRNKQGSKIQLIHQNRLKKYNELNRVQETVLDSSSESEENQDDETNRNTDSNKEKPKRERLRKDDKDRRFCIRRQTEHGQMIACDNSTCPSPEEWYHFGCMKLDSTPNECFCPKCKSN